ncbi:MAG: isocitrate/isopropylmalate dehydrogenase family protein, partial [Clostridiaceae bacterium]
VLESTGIDFYFETQNAGEAEYNLHGKLIPDSLFESFERNKVALKGPITTPIGKGFRSLNVELRKKYDLFTNVRPVKNLGNCPSAFKKVNLIIFRENTEDLYAGVEEMISPDEAHSIKIITRPKSKRIAEAAFAYASKTGRKKITVVTKANIMKLTDGMFLDEARKIASEYPHIEFEELLVDNMCMQLVMRPSNYDIILTENLYGDILSDLTAGLIGGLGLVPSSNIGEHMALFEAVHGSAIDIAGKNIANPTAIILSSAMMLQHLGESIAADWINTAVNEVLLLSENFTKDLGGNLSTTEFTDKIIAAINSYRLK